MPEPENTEFYAFSEKRHEKPERKQALNPDWRMVERLKTVSVAVCLCLNIGIDPPDVVKTNPCAKLECWVDPYSLPSQKALDLIGRTLQLQYEVWQPRAKYRLSLDPSVDDLKKLCCSLRRNSKDERILFHYNGHGVPKPTFGGEIWLFNKNYTQYIPVSIFDVQSWLGSPCIYVYDCSNAANILNALNKFSLKDSRNLTDLDSESDSISRDSIQLAACGPNEILPMNPDLPADFFTCCLTTPIEISLRWFVSQDPFLKQTITPDIISKIPGRLSDRRTPLGELNWIFTSITDTIAWNVLPNDMFKRFFRQDLMVAALFRNFLLASRIMRYYRCHPVSYPELPETHHHSMWQSWDLAAESCLSQLPSIFAAEEAGSPIEYKHSSFFAEQLTAFEVWLRKGVVSKSPPQQLPIVLQVLLSQIYRLRALMLLSRFLDLGPWAVQLALSVGIFPYILKLLQSPASELKLVLVFIWAKILAVDNSCQSDLLKDNGYTYFINILNSNSSVSIPNISEHLAMSVFILSVFCNKFKVGQAACLKSDLIPSLMVYINDHDPLLRQWVCICLGKLWEDYPDAKDAAIKALVYENIIVLLSDPIPEVRTSAISAIGLLIDEDSIVGEKFNQGVIVPVLNSIHDASPLVRNEVCFTLAKFMSFYNAKFVSVAINLLEEKKRNDKRVFQIDNDLGGFKSKASVYAIALKALLILSVDNVQHVSLNASKTVDALMKEVLSSSVIDQSLVSAVINHDSVKHALDSPANNPAPLFSIDSGDVISQTLKKSASIVSFANSFKNLAAVFSAASISEVPISAPPNMIRSKESNASIKALAVSHSAASLTHLPEQSTSKDFLKRSDFFESCCEYFSEPQMRVSEVEDPGSVKFVERKWRSRRNEKIFKKSGQDRRVDNLVNDNMVSSLLFNQYEPYLVSCNDQDGITVFNWIEGTRSSFFRNGPKSQISATKFLNDDDLPLLLVGSNDGWIKVYRNYQSKVDRHLVTAWKCLESNPRNKPRVVLDWQQTTGCLFSGSNKFVSVWDVEHEICCMNMQSKSDANLSCISVDEFNPFLVSCGFENGLVEVFDKRLSASSSVAYELSMGSNARVLNVTGVADSQIFVGNASGEIKLYDCRNSSVFKLHDIGKEVNNYNLNYKKNLIACSTMDGIKKIALDGLIERDHQDFVGNVRCLKFVPFKDDCAYSTGSINIGFA